MDTQNRRSSAAVDDILEELKGKGRPAKSGNAAALDNILAELGMEGAAPKAKSPSRAKAPAARVAPAKVLQVGALAAGPQATPPQAGAPASEPAEAPVPPVAEAPRTLSYEQALAARNPDAEAARAEKAKRPGQPEVFEAVAPAAKPTGGDGATQVVERPSQRMNRINRGKVSKGHTASIMDIEPIGQTVSIPRVGKAAAMDKVDHGKYEGDTELLSWFTPEEEGLTKREKRRMEKERKKQEAADRRAAKRGEQAPSEGDFSLIRPASADDSGPGTVADDLEEIAFIEVKREKSLPDVSGLYPDTLAPAKAAAPRAEAPARQTSAAPSAPAEAASQSAVQPDEEGWMVLDASSRLDAFQTSDNIELPGSGRGAEAPPHTPASQVPPARTAAPKKAAAPRPAGTTARPDGTAISSIDLGGGVAKAASVGAATAAAASAPKAAASAPARVAKLTDTQTYEPGEEGGREPVKIPTAAYTQEFETEGHMVATQELEAKEGKSLFLDEMVDDQFRAFFGETIIMEKDEIDNTSATGKVRRKNRKTKTSLFTGEFAQLALDAEAEEELAAAAGEEPEIEEYSHPGDADRVQANLDKLKSSLTLRSIASGVLCLLLLWLGLGYAGLLPLPFLDTAAHPVAFGVTYLVLLVGAVVLNFTTIAAGLAGLVGEPTVDSAPALAALFALLQGVVLLTGLAGGTLPAVTLFGGMAALLLAANALGKRLRARVILDNFHLSSGGFDHSAAYILGSAQHELAHSITAGLEEKEPVLLVSRPTAFVKGFMRQSFSLRRSDGVGRILGWVLCGAGLVAGVVSYVLAEDMTAAVSSAAAVLCIGAPLSSTLLSAVPSAIMQQNNAKVGAVVPGWSAIEELGNVNVVMAGARDIFPPASVSLKGIKTYEKERIDLAILYAASVLIEGCDTLRDIFDGVIQGKSDMLYKVESLTREPGRGFTAWVENQRLVIGTREMLQRHAIDPPSIESEMQYTKEGCLPVYLAVSGKLFAMFVVRYAPDPEVADTLESLVNGGLSLLVQSDDMNITADLIERAYGLPKGVVKVLGQKELELLEPMTAYQPESAGVMSHIGTFTSFIGGMRAAAGCALSEKWSGYVQMAAVGFGALISLLLVASGGLAGLSMGIILLYQLGWTLFVCATPLLHRF